MARIPFTPEEQARIMALPVCSFKIGGSRQSGHYDESDSTFYVIDENGMLTGLAGKIKSKAPPAPPPEEQEPASPPPSQDETERRDDYDDQREDKRPKRRERQPRHTEVREKPRRGKPEKEKKEGMDTPTKVVIVVVAVVMFGILCGVLLPSLSHKADEQPPAEVSVAEEVVSETSGENEKEDEEVVIPADSIAVIQTTVDITKGSPISEDNIKQTVIPQSEYNQLVALGTTPCKWDEVSSVLGLYASSFISSGTYISNSYLSISDPTPTNPWEQTPDGYTTITIDAASLRESSSPLFYGETATVYVSRTLDASAGEFVVGEDADPNLEYMSYTESENEDGTITGTYEISNAIVVDILNADGESVLPYYAQYIDMPTINRLAVLQELCKDEDFVNNVTGVAAVVRVANAQVEVMGDIEAASFEMSVSGTADTQTDAEYTVAWGTQAIEKAVQDARVKGLDEDSEVAPAVEEGAVVDEETEDAENNTDGEG